MFSKDEFENEAFKKGAYSGLDLKHKSFSRCIFESCDFTESDLTSCKLFECKLINCNFSLVKLDGCRLQDVEFFSGKLVGVNFSKCDRMFLSLRFAKCLIGTSNFSGLDLKGAIFRECTIRDTYFNEANLTGADLAGSDLKGSVFHNCNLTKASFLNAINYSINPLTNKLSKTKFSKPEVLALLDNLDIIIE